MLSPQLKLSSGVLPHTWSSFSQKFSLQFLKMQEVMHHSHVTEVGCHMHGSNQNIIEVMISQMSCDHVQWFQWLQLVIHNRYVDNPNLVSYVLEQPEMLRNRDYKHSNVVHQSSVRPLYLVM